MSPRLQTLSALLALALLAPAAQRVRASELDDRSELREKLKALVKQVAELPKKENQTAVALGEFTGPPALASNPGPGLVNLLAAELERQRIKEDPRSWFTIKGEFMTAEGESKEDLILRVVLNV